VAWGDYDNDGRLDVLLTGMHKVGPVIGPISQIWRNMGTGFTQTVSTDLPGVFQSSAAWGDYDNDGRLDILITGRTNLNFPSGISQVWRNTGSGFTNINAGLPGVYRSSVAWGDYDSDGRLDILLTGDGASSTGVSQVWRNTGNGFTNISAGLPGVFAGSAIWGDYDNDGRLDILLNGYHFSPICQIWRNTGSGFININPGLPENVLPGVFTSSAVGVTTTTTGGWTFCSLAEVLNLPGSRCFLLPKYGAIGRRSPIRHQLPQPVWRRPLSVARSS
jgi:hypothetical protein